MFEAKRILYFYTETPVHPGSGSGLGVVDLPIQRERATGYPMFQASGIKGKLRAEAEELKGRQDPLVIAAFGPDTNASDHAGALAVGDGRILLFPVRSLMGVFAWVTSKAVLARFARDAAIKPADWTPIGPDVENKALVAASGNDVSIKTEKKVVLEEFTFDAVEENKVKTIADWLAKNTLPESADYDYWREKLPHSLVILPENAFRDFTQFSTEVISRIKLNNEKKTVETVALWTEEYLTPDALLYAPIYASRSRSDLQRDGQQILQFAVDLGLKHLQLGGDETVGHGLARIRWSEEV